MTPPLNLYGDQMVPTSGRHGGDIASQRIDALDRACLEFCLSLGGDVGAVDIGCGLGAQGFRLAALGAAVTLCEPVDISARVAQFNELFPANPVRYLCCDARQLSAGNFEAPLHIVYSQRAIHYLRFDEARALLATLRDVCRPGARFFISASGVDSELGEGYAGASVDVEERMTPLALDMAAKHGVHDEICLYSKDDLARLGEAAGLEVFSVTVSDFGNKKAIFGLKDGSKVPYHQSSS
ncbi:MAG: methyltransferase domain-containing protein [Alphaproteobacteria bacterium]|nr:methyltransferase domain-containing protein [Alphaproteobacteria bacterium]